MQIMLKEEESLIIQMNSWTVIYGYFGIQFIDKLNSLVCIISCMKIVGYNYKKHQDKYNFNGKCQE